MGKNNLVNVMDNRPHTINNSTFMAMIGEKLQYKIAEPSSLFTFMVHVENPANDVRVNGRHLSYDEMAELIGVSVDEYKQALINLEKVDAIRVEMKSEDTPIIYMNPYVYNYETSIYGYVFDLFADSIYKKLYEEE